MTHEGTPHNGFQLDEATASIMVSCPIEGQDHGKMTLFEFANSENTRAFAEDVLNNAATFEKLGMERSDAVLQVLGRAAVMDPETQEVERSTDALAEAQARVEAAFVEVVDSEPKVPSISDAVEEVQEQRHAAESILDFSKKK